MSTKKQKPKKTPLFITIKDKKRQLGNEIEKKNNFLPISFLFAAAVIIIIPVHFVRA